MAFGDVFAGDGLSVVEDLYGIGRVEGCKKYKIGGRWPPGPCKKTIPSNADPVDGGPAAKPAQKTITKPRAAEKTIARPKAVPAAPTPKRPAAARKLTRAAATALQERMTRDQPWTDQQKQSLQEYTEHEYLFMNGKLRGVTPRAFGQNLTDADPAATDRRIKDVYDSTRPLPEPVRLFRNAYSADGLGLPQSFSHQELLANLRKLVGQKKQEKGFSSASIKPLTGKKGVNGDVRLDIEVPAGVRAAFVRSVSSQKSEDEWILEPGLVYEFYDLDETTEIPTVKARVVPA